MKTGLLLGAFILLSQLLAQAVEPGESPAGATQNGNARIVICGDSITGQGRAWIGAGFCYQLDAALKQVYPDSIPAIIALGGSGQGVGSWMRVEEKSRTTEVMLDVKDVDVKANLDQPADVLVVMLGMNDVLAPYIGGTDADLDQWKENYRKLILALQERVSPGITAVGTITMYTEAPDSFKNRQIARMNERIRALAGEIGAKVLPNGDACREVQELGRQLQPEFHITRDYIHPNAIGNQAVAVGILRGLGEEKAAEFLLEQQIKPALIKEAGSENVLSYEVSPQTGGNSFLVRVWWTNHLEPLAGKPTFTLDVPDGWTVESKGSTPGGEDFLVKGTPQRLITPLRIDAQLGDEKRERELVIPAPWLVASGLFQQWKQPPLEFDPKASVTPVDQAIAAGKDFTKAEIPDAGKALEWQPLFPSVNLTGGADPGSVDYAAVTNGGTFEGGYAARWIFSDHDRPVELALKTNGLGARIYLTVWLNAKIVYQNDLTMDPALKKSHKVIVPANLQEGENQLVIKSNHTNWQWQFAANLSGLDGDSLADLRYAIAPQKSNPPALK